jgi:hypothetical protein
LIWTLKPKSLSNSLGSSVTIFSDRGTKEDNFDASRRIYELIRRGRPELSAGRSKDFNLQHLDKAESAAYLSAYSTDIGGTFPGTEALLQCRECIASDDLIDE